MSLRVSWSSQSIKSSGSEKNSLYNRKRASVARHMQCMHHIGCRSKAPSGNMGGSHEFACVTEFMVGKEFTVGKKFKVQ